MESINRDRASTPIFAPLSRSILLHLVRSDLHPENRGLCQSRLRLCIYIYRKISACFFLLEIYNTNILKFSHLKCRSFRTIFTSNFFSYDQSRERGSRFKYTRIYRELVWKLRDSRYLIAGYKEERRNSIGEYDRFVCFVFVIYVVIKLSIFDISSDKFDDTRWIKVHGSVLDGASSFLASCFQTCQFSNWSEFEWPLDGLMKLIPWLPSDAISVR